MEDFEGVAWTGSLLNIYEATPPIIRQIELAKKLLNKKNSIFGSCWGLQVLVTAAGGKVRKNPNGIEAIIAKKISLNEGTVLAADAETINLLAENSGFGTLGQLIVEAGTKLKSMEMDILEGANTDSYWEALISSIWRSTLVIPEKHLTPYVGC